MTEKCFGKRGSITVEVALALPLFFFGAVCFLYLLEIMAIQVQIHSATDYVARNLAKEVYLSSEVLPSQIKEQVAEAAGVERLNRSIVISGQDGLDASETTVDPDTGVISMCVAYQVKLPFSIFGENMGSYREAFIVKGWTGYCANANRGEESEMVYVTENGIVYHTSADCSYLNLSIHTTSMSKVGELRNESGGCYYACELCGNSESAGVLYVTEDGDSYHTSLSCSGLKRTVYCIPLSEAIGKGACSRCGQ